MAGIRIHVRSAHTDSLRAKLKRVKEFGLNPEPLLDIAGAYLVSSIQQHFQDGRSPAGFAWPSSWRAREQGGTTMIDKGALVSSIRHETTRDRVEVGVDGTSQSSKYAYVLHYGAVIFPKRGPFLVFTGPDGHKRFARKVTIPPRPFLGINAADVAGIDREWRDYAKRELA